MVTFVPNKKKKEKEGKNVGAQQSTRVYVKVKIGYTLN